ncbi:MAG: class I SAM-dependent methyltransferase [Alkalispirochaeta sp.]
MHSEYLEAKRRIDDRSINRRVWDRFLRMSERVASEVAGLRVAELGAGSGTMIDRLEEWGWFAGVARGSAGITYHAYEVNDEPLPLLQRRLAAAKERALIADALAVSGDLRTVLIDEPYDIIIAHALIDLFPPEDLPRILDRFARSGTIIYASIVFDGTTHFEPELDRDLDREILGAYHRSMSGGFARRHIVGLTDAGYTVVDAGSSDWVVVPRRSGFRREEKTLIATILDMLTSSVGAMTDRGETQFSRDDLASWVARRREQAAQGSLCFEAHQLDLVIRR